MAPTVYALLEPNAFMVSMDLGAAPVYIPFATPAVIKMINTNFKQENLPHVSEHLPCMLQNAQQSHSEPI